MAVLKAGLVQLNTRHDRAANVNAIERIVGFAAFITHYDEVTANADWARPPGR